MGGNWPEQECRNCGLDIRLVKTRYGWKPYEIDVFEPHSCGSDVYDLPSKKIRPLFNPGTKK